MSPTMRICLPEPLQAFAAGVFRTMGSAREVADEVARHLVQANLSGHDSHGVIRIPAYVKEADSGALQPAARPTMASEADAVAVVDAHRGFGQYSTAFALDWALERVHRYGLAAVAVRHSTHIGRLGEYTERAAARGVIAVVTVGAAGPGVGGVALHGGVGRFLGTNPWSVGVPGGHRSMVFDAATSVVAEGKVRVAHAKGAELPPGCLIDRDGNPTRSSGDFYEGGALLPLGGEVAGHKGYGLGLASALIGGLCMIDDAEPTQVGAWGPQAAPEPRGRIGGLFLFAVDPGAFGNADHYRSMVEEVLTAAKRTPPASGRTEVLVPGEPEVLSRHQRATGIGIAEATWSELAAVGYRFNVPLPEHRLA